LKPRSAWPDNPTAQNLIVVQWKLQPGCFDLIAVNLASHRGQCFVSPNVERLAERNWQMKDLLGQEKYERSGDDLQKRGLYLDLAEHGAQVFHFEPVT